MALLRGINVGGKNKVPMADLRDTFEAMGMEVATSYLNTGNVIFSSPVSPERRAVEEAVEHRFGFPLKILLRDGAAVTSIARAIPEGWVNDGTMKCDVLFLWGDVDHPAILDRLPARAGVDHLRYVPGAVIRRVDRDKLGKSAMTRLVGTELYRSMTIRNCNTVRKLAALPSLAGFRPHASRILSRSRSCRAPRREGTDRCPWSRRGGHAPSRRHGEPRLYPRWRCDTP